MQRWRSNLGKPALLRRFWKSAQSYRYRVFLKYCFTYGGASDTRHFKTLCLDGHYMKDFDSLDVYQNSDFFSRNGRWATLLSRCVRSVYQVDPFDIPFERHRDEVGYLCSLQLFFICVKPDGGSRNSDLCCLSKPNDTLYLPKDTSDQRRKLDIERPQHVIVRGSHYIGWLNLELFSVLPRLHDSVSSFWPNHCSYANHQRS